MEDITLVWIDIAKKVSVNPFVKLRCPKCNKEYLNISVVPWPGIENKIDIHLICNNCNIRNTITKDIIE